MSDRLCWTVLFIIHINIRKCLTVWDHNIYFVSKIGLIARIIFISYKKRRIYAINFCRTEYDSMYHLLFMQLLFPYAFIRNSGQQYISLITAFHVRGKISHQDIICIPVSYHELPFPDSLIFKSQFPVSIYGIYIA